LIIDWLTDPRPSRTDRNMSLKVMPATDLVESGKKAK
jgi:hypothetical protein